MHSACNQCLQEILCNLVCSTGENGALLLSD